MAITTVLYTNIWAIVAIIASNCIHVFSVAFTAVQSTNETLAQVLPVDTKFKGKVPGETVAKPHHRVVLQKCVPYINSTNLFGVHDIIGL